MAIYIRSRPSTGAKALGCLSLLATIGLVFAYPFLLLLSGFIAGSLDEAFTDGEEDMWSQVLDTMSSLLIMTAVYSLVLTSLCFGAFLLFKGSDRHLSRSATLSQRDIETARFLHVAKEPEIRLVGLLRAMLAVSMLVASPIITIVVPRPLSYLVSWGMDRVTWVISLLQVVLFLVLVTTAVLRRSSAIRLTPLSMTVENLVCLSPALYSDRDSFRLREKPKRRGRVQVQAIYLPPRTGTKPAPPVVIPQLSLTVRPSRLEDARRQVEARLDEAWRACELVCVPVQHEATPASEEVSDPGPEPTETTHH